MPEKTPESPLDSKEIKPVNPKGNQSWIFTGRMDTEAEAPILWPPDTKSRLMEKTLMLGKIEGRRRRGRQRMRWLDSITDSMDMNLSKHLDIVRDRRAWCVAVQRVTKSRTWLCNWKTTTMSKDTTVHTCTVYIILMVRNWVLEPDYLSLDPLDIEKDTDGLQASISHYKWGWC